MVLKYCRLNSGLHISHSLVSRCPQYLMELSLFNTCYRLRLPMEVIHNTDNTSFECDFSSESAIENDSGPPVSYTHLDVYKRQTQYSST